MPVSRSEGRLIIVTYTLLELSEFARRVENLERGNRESVTRESTLYYFRE